MRRIILSQLLTTGSDISISMNTGVNASSLLAIDAGLQSLSFDAEERALSVEAETFILFVIVDETFTWR